MPANPTTDLLVITCASGKQISFLLPLLTPTWSRLRLICNSTTSQTRLQSQYPTAEVLSLDLQDRSSCLAALKDATVCIHIGPSMHPQETTIGINMIDAAIEASGSRADGRSGAGIYKHVADAGSANVTKTNDGQGTFKHFIFSSVLNTQLRKLLNHDVKRYVEEYLMESGLEYTILQPAHFMQNFQPSVREMKEMADRGEQPVYRIAFDPDVKFGFLDLADYARLMATVLEERERHFNALYQACSTEPVSYTDRVEGIGRVIGKEVRIEKVQFDKAIESYVQRLMGEKGTNSASRDELERMLLYYNRHGLVGSPTIMELVTGKKSTTLEEWAKRSLAGGK